MSSKLKGDLAPKSNKTPYELRLEILHLAQHIIDRENENQLTVLHLQNEKSENFTPIEELGLRCTEDKILEVAKKLNSFVSNG
jgi:hypothetical protein